MEKKEKSVAVDYKESSGSRNFNVGVFISFPNPEIVAHSKRTNHCCSQRGQKYESPFAIKEKEIFQVGHYVKKNIFLEGPLCKCFFLFFFFAGWVGGIFKKKKNLTA